MQEEWSGATRKGSPTAGHGALLRFSPDLVLSVVGVSTEKQSSTPFTWLKNTADPQEKHHCSDPGTKTMDCSVSHHREETVYVNVRSLNDIFVINSNDFHSAGFLMALAIGKKRHLQNHVRNFQVQAKPRSPNSKLSALAYPRAKFRVREANSKASWHWPAGLWGLANVCLHPKGAQLLLSSQYPNADVGPEWLIFQIFQKKFRILKCRNFQLLHVGAKNLTLGQTHFQFVTFL